MSAPTVERHIVAVWHDGRHGQQVAPEVPGVSADYSLGWWRFANLGSANPCPMRGLYAVDWPLDEDAPPTVTRVGDLPDVDALAVLP